MFLYLFGRIKAFNHEVGVASFRYRAREGGLGVAAKAAEVSVCKHQFGDKQDLAATLKNIIGALSFMGQIFFT
jgi:hypothetical protein